MTSAPLGVSYDLERYTEADWTADAAQMTAAGIGSVWIGARAWGRLEPNPGDMNWGWLDLAIDTFGQAGLSITLTVPTAVPPVWMFDQLPDLACDRSRSAQAPFGAASEINVAHREFRGEVRRICLALAARYGRSPQVTAWQIPHPFGLGQRRFRASAAVTAFQAWLARRYGTIWSLNDAWGTVLVGTDFRSFDEIGLPPENEGDANPVHRLDYARFCADAATQWVSTQTAAIRSHAVQPIGHGLPEGTLSAHPWALAQKTDISTLETGPVVTSTDTPNLVEDGTEDPATAADRSAFFCDLARASEDGKWSISKFLWAPTGADVYQAPPSPKRIALQAWCAFAHGAQSIAFADWRATPQAVAHTQYGLCPAQGTESALLTEIRRLADAFGSAAPLRQDPAKVALIVDPEAEWMTEVDPGTCLPPWSQALAFYIALRRLGLAVDVLPSDTNALTSYRLALVAGLRHMPDGLQQALTRSHAQILLGPVTGTHDAAMRRVPRDTAALPSLSVTVETIRDLGPDGAPLSDGGRLFGLMATLRGDAQIDARLESGAPVLLRQGRINVMAGLPDIETLTSWIASLAKRAGVAHERLPPGLRLHMTPERGFAFNHSETDVIWNDRTLSPLSVQWWTR